MKHTQKRLFLITILFFTVLPSCKVNVIEPESSFDLKSLMKETVLFSLDSDNYTMSNKTGFFFNSEQYKRDVLENYESFSTLEIDLSDIQYNGQKPINFKYESSEVHSEEFSNFHEQLLNLSLDQEVGYSESYFVELEILANKISESNLNLESKHALLNSIQFSYIAYSAIDELSNQIPDPVITSKSIAYGIESGCKFNWNDVLRTALTDMAWGAVFGAITVGILGGVSGLGIATPITGLLGAFAGANMGAAAGFIEGFARGVVNNTIIYLWCKYA